MHVTKFAGIMLLSMVMTSFSWSPKTISQNVNYKSSVSKLIASEAAMKHTVEAVQIHGGNGYVKEYHVERLMRDAKITQIYEGTSEIQRVIISRNVLNGNLELPM